MKNFNRGGDRGGFRSGGDRGGFRGGNRGGFGGDRGGRPSFGDRPTMHKTTCSECGNVAEVPFKPTGDKPVLCSNCFGGGDRSDRSRGGDRGGRPSFGDRSSRPPQNNTGGDFSKLKEEMSALNSKLDTLINLMKKDSQSVETTVTKEESTKKVAKRERPKAGELTKAVKKAVKSEKKEATKTTKKVAKKK